MKYFYRSIYLAALFGTLRLFAGGQGYHEWHDELNDYNFQEPQFQDVTPITPYEDANPVFYDFSPYLDPHTVDPE